MTPLTLLAFCSLVLACGSFPLIGERRHPVYTAESIRELYTERAPSLAQTEPQSVVSVIDMLVQVALQQQTRLDLLEGSQASLRTDLAEVSVELSYVKKFVYEQMSLYHKDSEIVRQTPQKSLFMPAWDVNQNLQVDTGMRSVSKELRSINNSLTALSLRVDTLDYHLEEVEAIVYAIKESTSDEFSGIINQVIPELHESVVNRYEQMMSDQVVSIMDDYVASGNLSTNQLPPGQRPCRIQISDELGSVDCQIGPTPPPSDTAEPGEKGGEILPPDKEETPEKEQQTGIISPDAEQQTGVTSADEQTADSVEQEVEVESESNFTSKADLINYYRSRCDRVEVVGVKEKFEVQVVYGKRNKVTGSWLQDSFTKSSSIYMTEGYRKIALLLEFSNIIAFSKGVISRAYDLPFMCGGTGHVVYNNSFYCHGFKSNKIYKFDLQSKEWNETRLIGDDIHGSYGYSIGGFNDADLMADSGGLWVVYASRQSEGNIIIARIDPLLLRIEYMENTTTYMTQVSNSFMICGELYSIFHSADRGKTLQKVWSLYDSDSELPASTGNMTLDSDTSVLMMAEFNIRDHRLYTWNLIRLGEATLNWYQLELQQLS